MTDSIVTPAEFSRYGEQYLGDFKCEVCGTQEWMLELDPAIEAGPAFRVEQTSEDGQPMRVLSRVPTCIVSCKHCGNMKMFLRERVETWLRGHPDG